MDQLNFCWRQFLAFVSAQRVTLRYVSHESIVHPCCVSNSSSKLNRSNSVLRMKHVAIELLLMFRRRFFEISSKPRGRRDVQHQVLL